MKLAIITDSTSDLKKEELERLQVEAVPLHVNFQQAVAPSFEQPVDVKALLGLVLASPPPEEHAVAHLLRLSVEGLDWLEGRGQVVAQRQDHEGEEE